MSGGNKPTSSGDYMVLPSTMRIINPNEACSEAYIIVGVFKKKAEAQNMITYLETKFMRFLLLQALTGNW
jgi:site-specific DNA-methyltransferase (adenine-specific)